ncbi:hypothetical protein EXW72_08220 [Pseudomonas sp. BCA14]|nr:hypothetical protein EXW70_04270 [Pseudomonas sp. JMN1]TFF15570.1 hypothetical protein EXW71_04770 [Pseudomonas sp. BCA17]TFF31977.1 hypothetical protein EXW72_08220 [Pseudomonas sp. BCA14]TFF32930.1 hypothetical protein EXW73_04020 [Pseudomonas sp. BCA13]
MAYGLTFLNSSGVVTLDSEFSRLVIIYSGRYSGGGAIFPSPVTSQEPPLIFARPDSSANFQWVRIAGSPGNWTGWSNSSSAGVPGSYFLAAYESKPTDTYGMRIWGGSSKLLFDSGTPCAQFTTVITAWTFNGSVNNSPGRWSFYWSAPSPLSNGDYMLINNIAQDIPGGDTFSKLTCTFNYQTNTVNVLLQNIGDFNGNNLFLPVLFAKQIS